MATLGEETKTSPPTHAAQRAYLERRVSFREAIQRGFLGNKHAPCQLLTISFMNDFK